MENEYKFKIDKEILKDFFTSEGDPTPEHLKEIKKVFNVVMIKHHSSQLKMSDELVGYAILALLERRKQYDPSYSAYNYIYSIFRNEVGNKLHKLQNPKEFYMEDLLSFKERMVDTGKDELPQEVQRYTEYLTGQKNYTFIRIPKKDVLDLLIFLRSFESKREVKVPEFILKSKGIIKVLYKLLKELMES